MKKLYCLLLTHFIHSSVFASICRFDCVLAWRLMLISVCVCSKRVELKRSERIFGGLKRMSIGERKLQLSDAQILFKSDLLQMGPTQFAVRFVRVQIHESREQEQRFEPVRRWAMHLELLTHNFKFFWHFFSFFQPAISAFDMSE